MDLTNTSPLVVAVGGAVNPKLPVSITPAEIPQDVLEEVCEKLWTYTAPLFAVDGAKPLYRGTATCVAASGKYYLLSAAHVWRELRGDRFALALEADHPLIPIYKDFVEATIFEPGGPPEWGPDLALIKLPDIDSANIRRVKAFYNLDKRKPESGGRAGYDKGLWGVIGVPAELSIFGETEAELKIRLFASEVVSAHERGRLRLRRSRVLPSRPVGPPEVIWRPQRLGSVAGVDHKISFRLSFMDWRGSARRGSVLSEVH